jgi:putative transposase
VHPEQNGRHERMHRTLKQEVAQPPAANWREQQRGMEKFRQEYNQVRPHEALEMQTPAEVYEPSPRSFPARVPEPEYPDDMLVRQVKHQGQFRWKKQDVFLSEVLWGEPVGLLAEDDRWYTVYFARFPIARFDSRQLRVLPLKKAKEYDEANAGEGEASPSPAPHPLKQEENEVSGMCPV